MSKNFDDAVKRLSKIAWRKSQNKLLDSNFILVNEYLRRSALLIKENSLEIEREYPFGYYARQLGGKELENYDEVRLLFDKSIQYTHTEAVCEKYLEWMVMADKGNVIVRKYFSLYEPLIKLFERYGVQVGKIHMGFIVIGNSLIHRPSPDYLVKIEEKDISDEALDNYDREEREQFKKI